MVKLTAKTLVNYKGVAHAAGWQFEVVDEDAKALVDSGQAEPTAESANSGSPDTTRS